MAQGERRVFAGALVGVSALSADARATTMGETARVSLYDPANGLAANVFVGLHVAPYFTLQANYVWNRNDVMLLSSYAAPTGGAFVMQTRGTAQHAAVADGLIYFRRLDSRIRPYLGTGLAVVHFTSAEYSTDAGRLSAPDSAVSTTRLALRSHVGIDVAISSRLSIRYSFSETIGPNPVSPLLDPPGRRPLMNFQNLFGVFARF